MWAQAVVSGVKQEGQFLDRMRFIKEKYVDQDDNLMQDKLKKDIETIRKKVKKDHSQALSEEEWQILEIKAFFEAVALQQEPQFALPWFHVDQIQQREKHLIYPLTFSKEMDDKREPLYLNDIPPSSFTGESLKDYLEDIASLIVENNGGPMVIKVLARTHTIGLQYEYDQNTKQGHWIIMDINLSGVNYLTSDSTNCARFIMEACARNETNTMPILQVISQQPEKSFIEALNKLRIKAIKNHPNILEAKDSAHGSLLRIATKLSDLELVKLAYEKAKQQAPDENSLKAFLNDQHLVGYTPLMIAAVLPNLDIVNFLLACGADVNIVSQKEESALSLAFSNIKQIQAQRRHNRMLAFPNTEDSDGSLEFMEEMQVIHALLDKGADPNVKCDTQGMTPLIYAAMDGLTDIAHHLIEKGANVDQRDNLGQTALMFACSNGRPEIIKLLLKRGADIHAESNDYRSPLNWSCKGGHTEAVKVLIDEGAGFNSLDISAAVAKGNKKLLEFLLKKIYEEKLEHNIDSELLKQMERMVNPLPDQSVAQLGNIMKELIGACDTIKEAQKQKDRPSFFQYQSQTKESKRERKKILDSIRSESEKFLGLIESGVVTDHELLTYFENLHDYFQQIILLNDKNNIPISDTDPYNEVTLTPMKKIADVVVSSKKDNPLKPS